MTTFADSAKRKRMTGAQPPAPAQDDDDDPVPTNPDEFRRELARRIHNFLRSWRDCPLPLCKRTRTCHGGETFWCTQDQPKLTPAQRSRFQATLYKAVRRELAKRGTIDAGDKRAVTR